VAIIGVGTGPSAVAAVRAGHVDAIANIEPVISMLERAGAIVVPVETVSANGSKALFGATLPSGCLYTKATFVRDNPNTVQALTNAMVRALHWLAKATPDEVARTVPQDYLLGDRALYLAAYSRQRQSYSRDGRIAPDAAAAMHKVLAGFETSVRSMSGFDVTTTYTNRFVEAALAAGR
jgi:NitT/TauT family transport system substrate-binding protein